MTGNYELLGITGFERSMVTCIRFCRLAKRNFMCIIMSCFIDQHEKYCVF